ncbi:MAG: phosphodiester glycosidase family protein [Candidatus Melainabacteria bacterium]
MTRPFMHRPHLAASTLASALVVLLSGLTLTAAAQLTPVPGDHLIQPDPQTPTESAGATEAPPAETPTAIEASGQPDILPEVRDLDFEYGLEGVTLTLTMNPMPKPEALSFQDWNDSHAVLAFNGVMTDNRRQQLRPVFSPNFHQLYVESIGNRIQLFAKRTLPRQTVLTRDDARHQIRLFFPHDSARSNRRSANGEPIHSILPGVRHLKKFEQTPRGPILLNVLEIDVNNPHVEVRPALAENRMGARARVSDMVSHNDAVAGVNGAFFKPDTGTSLGTLIIQQELISGPLFKRATLGIGKDHSLTIDHIDMRGDLYLPDDASIPINNINQPRVTLDQVVLYSRRWGSTAPKVPDRGYQFQITDGRLTAVSQSNSLPIPQNGYVITGPITPVLTRLSQLPMGSPIRLQFYTVPDWSNMAHALGGGPALVHNRQVIVNPASERFTTASLGTYEPRTAAGITADGKLLLVTVDGRQEQFSVGVSLRQLAELMIEYGAVDAMNLDGGSSTQMIVGGEVVNSPTAPNGAAVSTGLIVRER